MAMLSLWKCPRCWDNPCHCEVDAYGDSLPSQRRFSVVENRQQRQREIELLEEQNKLLREIRDKK